MSRAPRDLGGGIDPGAHFLRRRFQQVTLRKVHVHHVQAFRECNLSRRTYLLLQPCQNFNGLMSRTRESIVAGRSFPSGTSCRTASTVSTALLSEMT